MHALGTRGGLLAAAVVAVLVLVIGLAAGGAFSGCSTTTVDEGRPSAAASSSPRGGVAYATARVLAGTIGRRPADSWGEIHAREFISSTLEQYGYFARTDEFIAGTGRNRVHSANVVALKEGETPQRLVVGAHYDSAGAGKGYLDNATGVGLLLEVAARVKRRQTPYTLVFVAFGAEERGSLGAKQFLASMSKVDREATIGMINLDAPAGGDELTVMSRRGGFDWLRDDALSAAEALGLPLVTSPRSGGRPAGIVEAPSDDLHFAAEDIPTAVFSAVSWGRSRKGHMTATVDGRPIWNTARDTVAYVDGAAPGKVRRQLRQLSLLLETLLTSKLERHT